MSQHVNRVTVIGPNLLDQSRGDFHVHAAGCADIARSARRDPMFDQGWSINASSRLEIAGAIYEDIIAEDEGSSAADYLSTIHFAPCVTLPERVAKRDDSMDEWDACGRDCDGQRDLGDDLGAIVAAEARRIESNPHLWWAIRIREETGMGWDAACVLAEAQRDRLAAHEASGQLARERNDEQFGPAEADGLARVAAILAVLPGANVVRVPGGFQVGAFSMAPALALSKLCDAGLDARNVWGATVVYF